jgi:hypothetical protein
MIFKNNYIICFLVFLFFNTPVQGAENKCLACKDVQYAAGLSAIEKRLLELSNGSLQRLDDEALEWYETFQEGGMLFDGWQEISADVVAKVPEEAKLKTKVIMLALGLKIGCEWSKENDVRKISTSMLKDWGKQLKETVSDAPDHISVVLSSIEHEVNELLF